MVLQKYIRLLRTELKYYCDHYPSLFLLTRRFRNEWSQQLIVRHDTDIVIEGFGGSANSFSIRAFELAQHKHVTIAHHLHAAAQIIFGVRWGIPTLVLIRDPIDTIASLMSRGHVLSVRQTLVHYIRFYQTILPFKNGCVVGMFDEVVEDFGMVIRKVNKRFNSRFMEFENTTENIAHCLNQIDFAKPNAGRNIDMELARNKLNETKLQKHVQKAKTIHQMICRL